MKRIALLALTLVALFMVVPGSAYAQATRTWISGVGDDANPCSRTAPCKTFAGAISKTATNGEINCLDPGGFGAVTITKSITLDCTGTFGSILGALTNGININGANINVIIRGISLNGATTGLAGVKVFSAGSVVIDNVRIFGFGASGGSGIDIQPNQAANMRLDIRDTIVHNNAGIGILVKPLSTGKVSASLTRVNMHNNAVGLRAENNSVVTVFDSVAADNTTNGFVAVSTGNAVAIIIDRSASANNGNGVTTSGAAATIRLANTAVVNNGTGINTAAGGTVSSTSPATTFNAGNTTAGAPNGAAVNLQ